MPSLPATPHPGTTPITPVIGEDDPIIRFGVEIERLRLQREREEKQLHVALQGMAQAQKEKEARDEANRQQALFEEKERQRLVVEREAEESTRRLAEQELEERRLAKGKSVATSKRVLSEGEEDRPPIKRPRRPIVEIVTRSNPPIEISDDSSYVASPADDTPGPVRARSTRNRPVSPDAKICMGGQNVCQRCYDAGRTCEPALMLCVSSLRVLGRSTDDFAGRIRSVLGALITEKDVSLLSLSVVRSRNQLKR